MDRPPGDAFPEIAVSEASQSFVLADPLPAPTPGIPSTAIGEHEAGHCALITVEQAIAAYVQEMRATGRDSKTLQWHQTSLRALQRYLWRQFHLTDIGQLSRASIQTWVGDMPLVLSARTGAMRTVNTIAASRAPSARPATGWFGRGMCQKRSSRKAPYPKPSGAYPKRWSQRMARLRACQLAGSPGGQNAGMTARNRAILWLLLDTGLRVSELCGLRLADVDRAGGTVTVRGKGGKPAPSPCRRTGSAPCAPIWIRPVSRRPGSPQCQRHGIGSCSPSGGIL